MEAIDGRPLAEEADERLRLIIHAAAELRLSTSPAEAPRSGLESDWIKQKQLAGGLLGS